MRESLSDTIFKRFIHEEEVGSTNDLAMSLLVSNEDESFVVLADSQTSGRGRRGRRWYSPPGNVYMSLVVRPHFWLSNAPILTVLTGVAVCEGIRESNGLDMNLKWPNDIVLKKKKLGGILIETRIEGNIINAAVVGIGININIEREELPEDIQESATSMFIETGKTYRRDDIAVSVIKKFDSLLRNIVHRVTNGPKTDIDASEKKRLIEKWKQLDITLGSRVSVITDVETISGRALDIDEMCRLKILTDKGDERLIHSGDVILFS